MGKIENSSFDFLTSLPSRALLDSRLVEEIERAQEQKSPLTIFMVDIDHFKSINDAFGHNRGDVVLTEFAFRLHSSIRLEDMIFRYGGDEFVIILPNTEASHAVLIGQRLIKTIRSTPFQGAPPLSLSISIGLASYPMEASDAGALFEIADRRLFQAKRLGRGRVVSEDMSIQDFKSLEGFSRLIERDLPLEILNQFFDSSTNLNRSILQVNGVDGSGFTRYLTELGNMARLRNYAVFALRGNPALKMRVYGALNEGLLGWEGLPRPRAGVESFSLALNQWIVDNNKAGLLIILDDLHLIDPDTLLFIHDLYFSEHITGMALAYTNVDAQARGFLKEVHHQVVVTLTPLSIEGVQIWIRHSLQWEAPEDFLNWFFKQTGGYPRRIQAMLMHLAEREILQSCPEGWTYPPSFSDAFIEENLNIHPGIPNNLPLNLSDFIGREEEIEFLKQTMLERRLMTLYGPGGIGKTRLALQVAAEIQEEFRDGVYVVPVMAMTCFGEPIDCLAAAILEVINHPLDGNLPAHEQLINHLRSKDILLIIDGFLMLDRASILVEILEQCSGVKMLVTSFSRLGVNEEYPFELKELAYPLDEAIDSIESFPSYQLFVHNARHNVPQLLLSDHDRYAIASICRLVRGIPLDIELAAGWAGTFSFEEIAEEIENNLSIIDNPYDKTGRITDRRHDAVFDSLWHLLSEPEQLILARFSVFSGSFSLEAAKEVTGASRFFILSLAAQSYLKRTVNGRFEIHRLVKQYMIKKLIQNPQHERLTRDNHAKYYAYFIQQRAGLFRIGVQALEEIKNEWENIRQAWKWIVETGDIKLIDAMLDGWQDYNLYMGYYEDGQKSFQKAIEKIKELNPRGNALINGLLARLHCQQAVFFNNLTCLKDALKEIKLAVRLAQRYQMLPLLIEALRVRGEIFLKMKKYDLAKDSLTESLNLAWKANLVSFVLEDMAAFTRLALLQGDRDKALILFSNIINHPGLDEIVFRKTIRPIWTEFKAILPKNMMDNGFETGQELTMEEILRDMIQSY